MVDGKNPAEILWTWMHRLSELETGRKLAISLQILNKRVILDLDGEVTEYGLHSPFVSLRWFL
jgi:hypothetical protein